MKRTPLFFLMIFWCCISKGQNIGIGILAPQTKLHVYSNSTQVGLRVETNSLGDDAAVEIKTNGGLFDFLEIRKYASFASGSIGGIAVNDLSLIRTGANANGGLLFGTSGTHPIYFLSNNLERMRLTAAGSLGIGTNSPAATAIL